MWLINNTRFPVEDKSKWKTTNWEERYVVSNLNKKGWAVLKSKISNDDFSFVKLYPWQPSNCLSLALSLSFCLSTALVDLHFYSSKLIHSSTLAWKILWAGSLVGYSPWGRKESDTTERLHFHSLNWGAVYISSNCLTLTCIEPDNALTRPRGYLAFMTTIYIFFCKWIIFIFIEYF